MRPAIRVLPRTRRETPSRNRMPRSRAKTWIQALGKMDIKEARAAPGPERARPATPRYPGLDSGLLGWPLFPPPAWPGQRPLLYLAQTCPSEIEIRDENRCFRVVSKNTNELKIGAPGPFRSSSTRGEPQSWGSEAMSAIRVPRPVPKLGPAGIDERTAPLEIRLKL